MKDNLDLSISSKLNNAAIEKIDELEKKAEDIIKQNSNLSISLNNVTRLYEELKNKYDNIESYLKLKDDKLKELEIKLIQNKNENNTLKEALLRNTEKLSLSKKDFINKMYKLKQILK